MPTTAGTRGRISTRASTGAGTMATPLKPGVDCPATAAFLPSTFGDDKGEPITTPNSLCIFERANGDPIWRHAESLNQTYEGRAERRARRADGCHRRQLRLPLRLGVQRCGGNRRPRWSDRHRQRERRVDDAHERPDGGGRHALRHARRAQPRRREPRPLLQFPPRPRRRRHRQQLQSGHLPTRDAACRLAPPQHLRRRAQDCRDREGRRSSPPGTSRPSSA